MKYLGGGPLKGHPDFETKSFDAAARASAGRPDAVDRLTKHRLSMLDGPDEQTPPFCECGAWWPCSEAKMPQPLEPWERQLAEEMFSEPAESRKGEEGT